MTEKKDNIKTLKLAQKIPKETTYHKVSEENLEILADITKRVNNEPSETPINNDAIKAVLLMIENLIEGRFDEVVLLGISKQGGIYMGGGGDAGNKFMVGTILKEYSAIFNGHLADSLGLYDIDLLED